MSRDKGLLLWVLRSLASFVLGIIIFIGFLLLLANGVSLKLLNPSFYTTTLNEQDAYNRIYDQVLLDDEVKKSAERLLGDIKVLDHKDTVQLLRDIIPPDYLKDQVEGAIKDATDYLKKDVNTLELSIDFGPPLARVKPVLFKYIDQRIDGLEVVEPGQSGCEPAQLERLRASYQVFFRELAAGKVPRSVPSVKAVGPLCRGPVFDSIFAELVGDPSLDGRVRQGLRNSREDIRREFVAGDTRSVLRVAARPMATPLTDDAIAEISQGLDRQGQFAIIPWIAQRDIGVTEPELRADIGDVRDRLVIGQSSYKILALIMVIGGAMLMGLVHWPRLGHALRWPSLTLLLTGVVFFVVGKIGGSVLANALDNLISQASAGASRIPPSARDLASDILRSLAEQIASGFTGPPLVLIIVGAALLAGSFSFGGFRPLGRNHQDTKS